MPRGRLARERVLAAADGKYAARVAFDIAAYDTPPPPPSS